MPLFSPIKPVDNREVAKDLVIANEILRETGLTKLAAPQDECAQILDELGYTLKDSLQDLITIAKFSDDEKTRLDANKTILTLRNKLGSRKDEQVDKGVQFVLNGNVQINQNSILNPQRG